MRWNVPICEYLCDSCEHRFEVKQKITDPPLTGCTRCGKPVTKLISSPAIMFKGSGWYVTDYSDKLKPPAEAKAEGKPANGGGEKGDKKEAPAAAPASLQDSGSASPTPAPSSSSGSSNTESKPAPSKSTPSS